MSEVRSKTETNVFTRGGGDEAYFDVERAGRPRGFDVRLLQEPVTVLSTRSPLIFAETSPTSEAMRAMQNQHRGVVLITDLGQDPPQEPQRTLGEAID